MPAKKPRKQKSKIHQKRRKKYLAKRYWLLLILGITLLITGFYLRNKISFYYAMYFRKTTPTHLSNSAMEEARIQRIISENTENIFGIDISHYQRKEDITWDSLSLAKGSLPIDFVILRATMGNASADKHFTEFWKNAKKANLVRGAYHFYRADEDPILQANNFLENVKLEKGDLPPVLDIEKMPKRKTQEKLLEDLKTWCKIVEEAYGTKPIIYTYYYYYHDYLQGEFNDYPLWLANYNDVSEPSPDHLWKMWQFTDKGIVHGIDTKVDLNIYRGNLWSLKNLTLD